MIDICPPPRVTHGGTEHGKEIHLNKFMRHALETHVTPEFCKRSYRHITMITRGGKILSIGDCNLSGKPAFCSHHCRGRSSHSEMTALKKLYSSQRDIFPHGSLIKTHRTNKTKRVCAPKRSKLSRCTVWNFRWNSDGTITESKPCYHCQQTMMKLGFQKIVYSKKDGSLEKTRLDHLKCTMSSGYTY